MRRGGYEDIFHMLIGAGADPAVETRAGGGDPYYTPRMNSSALHSKLEPLTRRFLSHDCEHSREC